MAPRKKFLEITLPIGLCINQLICAHFKHYILDSFSNLAYFSCVMHDDYHYECEAYTLYIEKILQIDKMHTWFNVYNVHKIGVGFNTSSSFRPIMANYHYPHSFLHTCTSIRLHNTSLISQLVFNF